MNKPAPPVLSPPPTRTAPRLIREIDRIYAILQALSLDVVAGTVVSSAAVCWLMRVQPLPWRQLVVLGGTVWIIYTLDHLRDVRSMPGVPVTPRHRFHRRFFRGLLATVFLMSGWMAVLVMQLPASVIWFGCVTSSVVGLYFVLVHVSGEDHASGWFHKELAVAVVYTIGVWGGVWVRAGNVTWVHAVLAGMFGLIALQNLLLFSYYELADDYRQRQRSVVRTLGVKRIRILLHALPVIVLLAGAVVWYSGDDRVNTFVGIEWLMAVILWPLFAFPAYFCKNARYRRIGDAVFLLPLLVWLVG